MARIQKPKTVIKKYDGMQNFIQTINQGKNVLRRYSSECGSQDFTGTASYKEAENLLRTGYLEPLEEFKKAYKINSQTGKQRRIATNVIGFAPCVPHAIQGRPDSMVYYKHTPAKVKTINLVYVPCDNGDCSANYFIEGGKKIIQIIQEMERQNIRVNLYSIPIATRPKSDKKFIAMVNIKKAGQKLELKKLCFPLAHPSWLRRFGFRQLEVCSDFWDILNKTEKKQIYHGYGHALSDIEIKNAISPYIKQAVVFTVKTINNFSKDEIMQIIEGQINNTANR